MKEELRKIYPQLSEEELEEAEYNIKAYAEALAEIHLRIQREEQERRRSIAQNNDP